MPQMQASGQSAVVAWQTFGHMGLMRPRQLKLAGTPFACLQGNERLVLVHGGATMGAIWPCFVLSAHKKQASGQSTVVA